MDLRKTYEMLKQQAINKGQTLNDNALKQQAWILRDKMMFENSSNSFTSVSTSSAGGSLNCSLNSFVDNNYVCDYFE